MKVITHSMMGRDLRIPTLLLSVLLAILLLTGCGGGGGGGSTSATLSGKVVASTTSLPLTGATVTLSGAGSTTTNSTGDFSIQGSAGPHTLTVQLTGYDSNSQSIDVQAGNNTLPDLVRMVVSTTDQPPLPPPF